MNRYDYPIIVIHKGDQNYLKTCLLQAHFSNPNSRIILLGDTSNKNILPFVEHYNMSDYFETAKDLEKVYKHLSSVKYQFELLCIQRWFVLNEFLKKNSIEQFLHIDSDILVYSDFLKEDEYMEHLQNYDMTISYVSGHTSFYQNKEIIDRLCNFIMEKYQDKNFIKEAEAAYHNKSIYNDWNFKSPLSDMTWLFWFAKEKDVKCFDTQESIANSLINLNMTSSEFAFINEIINISFMDKKPYALNLKNNVFERFHTLHFQDWKKSLMPIYATYDKDKNWSQPKFEIEDFIKIIGGHKKVGELKIGKRIFTLSKEKIAKK